MSKAWGGGTSKAGADPLGGGGCGILAFGLAALVGLTSAVVALITGL